MILRADIRSLNRSAIYFDGYLPSSKEAERKKRLINLSNGLRGYFSLHPSRVPGGVPAIAVTSKSSFPTAARPNRRVPTPSFLVPAVLEALTLSETYAPLTRLVPGEADIFCARLVHSTGGVVLTSDSDLLIHDLGCAGSVVFFNSIEFQLQAGARITTAAEYSLQRICQRLGLSPNPGLSYLGFEVSLDPHLTLKQAVQSAKVGKYRGKYPMDYSKFLEQYLSPDIVDNEALGFMTEHPLDPRISEVLFKLLLTSQHQSVPAIAVTPPSQECVECVSMYLPFLVDSPARTSAWDTSTSIRQLAYTVAQLLTTNPISSVVEFRRLQSTTGGTVVHLKSQSVLGEMCVDLKDKITSVRAYAVQSELQWLTLAIYQDIAFSQEQEKNGILSLDLLEAVANGNLDVTSWDFVHLVAQIQGTYYSLRMLVQICDLVSRQVLLPEPVSTLQQAIKSLPLIEDFPSLANLATTFPRVRSGVNLRELADSMGLGEEICSRMEDIINPKENKRNMSNKRKRTNKSAARVGPAGAAFRSRNPFGVLADD